MVDEVNLEIEFDPIFGPRAKRRIVKESEETGEVAGRRLASSFLRQAGRIPAGIGGILRGVVRREISSFNTSVGATIAGGGLALFLREATQESLNLSRSFRGLNAVSRSFGLNAREVQEAVLNIAADGLVPTGDAAAALQNLLINFNGDLGKSVEVFNSLADASAVARQGQLGFSEAIVGAAEGLRSDISNKVDNAGITTNLSVLQRQYAESVGTTVGRLTEAQKSQAEYVGVLREAARFQGQYNILTMSFEGSLAAVSASTQLLVGSIGAIITRSTAAINSLRFITSELVRFRAQLDASADADILKPIILTVIDFGTALNNFVIIPVTSIGRVFRVVFSSVVTIINGAVSAIGRLGGALGGILNLVGAGGELSKGLEDFAESSRLVFSESLGDTGEAFANLFSPLEFSNAADEFLNGLRATVEESNGVISQVQSINPLQTSMDGVEGPNVTESFGVQLQLLTRQGQQFAIDWNKAMQQVRNSAVQGLGRGVGSAFSAFGRALATGENAISAFGKAFLASIGQAASALGQRFILEGIAISFNPLLGGPAVGGPLIGAGAALAVFGGALSGIGGGGGAGAAAGGGAGAGAVDTEESPLLEETAERADPTSQINLTVNGDVLDSDDTGLRIASILQDSLDRDGPVIVSGGAIS